MWVRTLEALFSDGYHSEGMRCIAVAAMTNGSLRPPSATRNGRSINAISVLMIVFRDLLWIGGYYVKTELLVWVTSINRLMWGMKLVGFKFRGEMYGVRKLCPFFFGDGLEIPFGSPIPEDSGAWYVVIPLKTTPTAGLRSTALRWIRPYYSTSPRNDATSIRTLS